MRTSVNWKLAAAAMLVMLFAASTHAGGYFNMPSSLRQCLGYGHGPGYHAPMRLAPAWKAPGAAQPIRRTRSLPSSADFSRLDSFGPAPIPDRTTPYGYGYFD